MAAPDAAGAAGAAGAASVEDLDAPLVAAAGLNSAQALAVAASLRRTLGLPQLSDLVLYDQPTAAAVAAHVHQLVHGGRGMILGSSLGTRSASSFGAGAGSDTDGGRAQAYFAGSASRRSDIMPAPRDGVTPVTVRSFGEDERVRELSSAFGSFLPAVEMFDAQLFGVHHAEATIIDPQQRVLLGAAVDAEVARHAAAAGEGSRCAVYVGLSYVDYAKLAGSDPADFRAQTAAGVSLSVASGRLAFCFNLKGPTLSIDTACSSSLVATHLGARAMGAGECRSAAVCGVNLTLLALTTAMFQRAGMLAPDGRCKTLDASADGYVRAEGCEVIMLTCSAEAGVALGGSAVNQDGRSSSLTAPNGPSQQGVIGSALKDGGVFASDVTSLQMHGTGTALGDPIEVGGLLGALGGSGTLVLGAIKSFVGHAECAAGAAGLVHAAASLCRRQVMSVMHLRGVNPHVSNAIAAATCGRVVLPKSAHGHAAQLGAAGVSSFAFQGTNAHVVVREGTKPRTTDTQRTHAIAEQRYWVGPMALALVTQAVPVIDAAATRFEIHTGLTDSPQLASMLDHCVRGRALFPAAGFLEAGSQVGAVLCSAPGLTAPVLQGVVITDPLLLKSGIVLIVDVNAAIGHFTIHSSSASDPQCVGNITHATLPSMTHAGNTQRAVPDLFGEPHGDAASYTVVDAPSECHGGYLVHPAVLDASFQQDAGFGAGRNGAQTCIPAQVDAYSAGHGLSGRNSRACFTRNAGKEHTPPGATMGTHRLFGSATVTCEGLLCKPVRSASLTCSGTGQRKTDVPGGMLTKEVPGLHSAVTDVASIRGTVLRIMSQVLHDGQVGGVASRNRVDIA